MLIVNNVVEHDTTPHDTKLQLPTRTACPLKVRIYSKPYKIAYININL